MLQFLSRSIAGVALASGVAFGQADVSFKPVLKPGAEFTYSIAMAADVSQQVGEEQPQVTPARASAHIKMKVLEVAADGSAKLEGSFVKASVQAPIGEQQVGFEWPSAALPAEAPPVMRLGETLEKATLAIDVDPNGKVTVSSGLDSFEGAAGKIDAPDDRHMGFFTLEKMSNALTPIFEVDGAGKAPRQVGKGWQTNVTVAMPPAGALDITTDFVVNDADSDVVNAFGQYAFALKRPENPAEGVASVELDPESAGGCKLVYDRHRMLLQHRKSSYALVTVWTLGDTRIRQRQVSILTARLLD